MKKEINMEKVIEAYKQAAGNLNKDELRTLSNLIDENSNDSFYKILRYTKDEKEWVDRINYGFGAWAILGALEQVKQDVLKQIAGEFKPDVVKRTIIEG